MRTDYLFDEREIALKNPLQVLRDCGGYYEVVKDIDGTRLSPLVGYAGKYPVIDDSSSEQDQSSQPKQLQYVGDVYCNFAKAETYPMVRRVWADILMGKMMIRGPMRAQLFGLHIRPNLVCLAAPMGGILFADSLAERLGCRVVFAEKRITKQATDSSREESVLELNRHEIPPGSQVLIVEDVCNNFSTTQELVDLVEKSRNTVIGIACELNRSKYKNKVPITIKSNESRVMRPEELDVYSLVYLEIPEYRQDDPFVAEDVKAGKVVWKPKDKEQWAKLKDSMTKGEHLRYLSGLTEE